MSYVISYESPSIENFISLRVAVGWQDELDANTVINSLSNSLFHVGVYNNTNKGDKDQRELIAIGRVVGDGAMYFSIQDIAYFQKLGLGKIVMDEIEEYLAKAAKKGATIALLSVAGKEGFYHQYGYIKRPNDSLGHGMCKFV